MKVLYTDSEFNNSKSFEKLSCGCYECGNAFLVEKKRIVRELKKLEGMVRFCNNNCLNKNNRKYHNVEKDCYHCGSKFVKKIRGKDTDEKKYFCSSSCSAKFYNSSRVITESHKKNISNSLRAVYSGESFLTEKKIRDSILNYEINCKSCGGLMQFRNKSNSRKTCSEECKRHSLSISGRRSASTRKLRSIDEIKLSDMCHGYFNDVVDNKVIVNGFDCDILINNQYAVLWNGPWHYKNIKMKGVSLSQIQNRDYIKVKELFNNGYIPIIYEDRYFSPLEAFNDLKNFILSQRVEL